MFAHTEGDATVLSRRPVCWTPKLVPYRTLKCPAYHQV